MASSDSSPFGPLVPGFDFLHGLAKNAGAAMPGLNQWIAPTVDPEEIDKRIGELKTVQFWLEQNARMIGATIQALEVQRMTLSTLKTMNVQMGDLRDALTVRPPAPASSPPAQQPASPAPPAVAAAAGGPPAAPGVIDPMQWWKALTQQFAELATTTMREGAANARQIAASLPTASAPTPPASGPDADAAAAKKAAARKSPPR